MTIEELETPVPIVDADLVEANLRKMQDYCDANGLALRPHIKTHKIPLLARRQLELGACGITCQKLGEAEVMVDAGIEDILISYPLIGLQKARRLAALASRARMSVGLDNAVALQTVASAAEMAGIPIGVLVEFDSGSKRTGVVSVAEALELAQAVSNHPLLSFDGLVTYPSTAATTSFIAAANEEFSRHGLDIRTVSGGGTPNAWSAHEVLGLTEVRVGTYIFYDRTQVAARAATLGECAFHVLATVVSRPTAERAILDCGSKSLSSDRNPICGPGFGLIREYPDAIIEMLYEEHALVDLSACATRPEIGDRVRVLPNHVCVVTNLHDELSVIQGQEVTDTWVVEARGKSR